MREILELSFTNLNSIWSILLGVFVLYWLVVIIGGMDVDAFDVDVDLDMDVDADLDIDMDGGTATEAAASQASFFVQALRFFNMGKIPFMVLMTIFVLCAWVISILGNYYLGNGSTTFSWIWLPITIVGALLASKIITEPIKKMINPLQSKFADSLNFIGKVGEVKMTTTKLDLGQAEVIFKDDPVLISIKSNTNDILRLGDKIIVVEHNTEENIYLVEPFNN